MKNKMFQKFKEKIGKIKKKSHIEMSLDLVIDSLN